MDEGSPPPPSPPPPPAPAASPTGPAVRLHTPVLARLRNAGRDPAAFAGPRTKRWFIFGVAALGVVALVPFLAPDWAGVSERLATLLSMVFLSGAIGLWLGMGGRSFVASTAFVVVLYGLTAWTPFAFPLQDFFVVAVLVSFAIFALAGFNLVFVLEEVMYDTQVLIHVRAPAWNVLPTAFVLTVAIGLPAWHRAGGGPDLPALWTASVAGSVILLGWWFLRVFNDIDGRKVLHELHLFIISALAVSALADAAATLRYLPSLIPSLIAYLVLLGSWVYASYTTLQRTHFLMSGRNAAPWVAILLGASYAILAHAQVLFRAGGTQAVADLADQRINYLMAGIWMGIAFFVLRGLWRVLRYVRDVRGLGERSRNFAGQAARVAGSLAGTERYVQGAAEAMFRGLDQVLPGEPRVPRKPTSWELEPDATLWPIEEQKR